MPTQRFRRRRAPARPNETIEAIRAGRPIKWSPEAWSTLIGARFFDEYEITKAEQARVVALMDEWRDQQHAYEQAQRTQRKREG